MIPSALQIKMSDQQRKFVWSLEVCLQSGIKDVLFAMYNKTHSLPGCNSVISRARFSGALEVATIDCLSELFTADLNGRLLEGVRPVGFRKAQGFIGHQLLDY